MSGTTLVPLSPFHPHRHVIMRHLALLLVLAAAHPAASLSAQSSATMPAVNDLPNPYRTVTDWAKLPAGRTWGSTSAVAIDKDGKSIWVAERCGVNNCAGSSLPSVLKFDDKGNLVTSFGAGMILSPHGIHVDKDGNVWVVDCACTLGAAATAPANAGKGHQIYKFSPKGELLMTLGAPGGGEAHPHQTARRRAPRPAARRAS